MSTALNFSKPILLPQLRKWGADWILDCEVRQPSKVSIEDYQVFLHRFFWFFESRAIEEVGPTELKRFAAYLSSGHLEPGGRWGNPRQRKQPSKSAVCFYLKNMRVFFNFLVREEVLEESPAKRVKSPIIRAEVKQALTEETVVLLLDAARRSTRPQRNEEW